VWQNHHTPAIAWTAFPSTDYGRGSAAIRCRIWYRWGWGMSVGRWGTVRRHRFAAVISGRSQRKAPSLTAFAAVIPILATLSACAPSPFVQNRTQFATPTPTPTRQATLNLRTAPSGNIAHQSVVRKVTVARKPDPATPAVLDAHPAANANSTSYGVASFYTEDEWTASGEKFNTHALTAAHPTLPFGTRLRVTNVSNGRSVVVRINDRGPFIPGRVVDLSESAAESLGMVERGIVKVKLDVVQKQSGSTASAKQF
jgi:rare lipoprotein A